MGLEETLMLMQTIALPATVLVLAWHVYVSRRTMQQDAYQRCESDYTAIVRLLIEKPELQKLYADLYGNEWTRYSDDERLIWNYLQLMYDLFDRIFRLYEQRWIDGATWRQWENWLRHLARHPLFINYHEATRGLFPTSYHQHVDRIIAEVQAK